MSEVKGSVSNVAWMQGRDECRCSEDHKTFYDFGRLKSNTVHYRGAPVSLKRATHAKTPRGNRVTRSKVHDEDPQIFGATGQNLFSQAAVGRDLYRVLIWGRESWRIICLTSSYQVYIVYRLAKNVGVLVESSEVLTAVLVKMQVGM